MKDFFTAGLPLSSSSYLSEDLRLFALSDYLRAFSNIYSAACAGSIFAGFTTSVTDRLNDPLLEVRGVTCFDFFLLGA